MQLTNAEKKKLQLYRFISFMRMSLQTPSQSRRSMSLLNLECSTGSKFDLILDSNPGIVNILLERTYGMSLAQNNISGTSLPVQLERPMGGVLLRGRRLCGRQAPKLKLPISHRGWHPKRYRRSYQMRRPISEIDLTIAQE